MLANRRVRIFHGKPISPGYTGGRAVVLEINQTDAPVRSVAAEDVEEELERFHHSLEKSHTELRRLSELYMDG